MHLFILNANRGGCGAVTKRWWERGFSCFAGNHQPDLVVEVQALQPKIVTHEVASQINKIKEWKREKNRLKIPKNTALLCYGINRRKERSRDLTIAGIQFTCTRIAMHY